MSETEPVRSPGLPDATELAERLTDYKAQMHAYADYIKVMVERVKMTESPTLMDALISQIDATLAAADSFTLTADLDAGDVLLYKVGEAELRLRQVRLRLKDMNNANRIAEIQAGLTEINVMFT